MVSGWFEPLALAPDGGGTAAMTLGCSDDFVAVRLGFPNVSPHPWRITRAIARPSAGFNDYVNPTGDAAWTTFTFQNAGCDSPAIVVCPDGQAEIKIRGIGGSRLEQAAGVSWTWTDWAPIRSLPPDPLTGLRVLMLRALVPSSQTITFANGQLRAFTGNKAVNRGHDMLIGGLKFNFDFVSEPCGIELPSTQAWIDNQLGPGTVFPLVQYLTNRPGISGLVAGDSHAQGTSTTEQFSSFIHGATAFLQRTHNTIPFSMVNCAVGGLQSEQFFARLETLIGAVQPSYAVLPGWTFNDESAGGRADRQAIDVFAARLFAAIEMCEMNEIQPIILTPFPRDADSMTEIQLGPWNWLRETILRLRHSTALVIDATTILGRQVGGLFDGTYNPTMTTDQMHPNDDGHLAIARALAKTVGSVLS